MYQNTFDTLFHYIIYIETIYFQYDIITAPLNKEFYCAKYTKTRLDRLT